MPASYTIHGDLRLLVVKYSGFVTDEDLLANSRSVYADPRWQQGFSELIDCTEAEDAEAGEDVFRQMLALAADAYGDSPAGFRTAVIATRDFVFGLARMYEALATGSPETARVFRDPVEAMSWLGIEPQPLSDLHAAGDAGH